MGFFKGVRQLTGSVNAGLIQNGIEGRAQIEDVTQTSLTKSAISDINRGHVMKFQLRVEIPGREPYAVAHKQPFGALSMAALQPGYWVTVWVNPDDPEDLVIDKEAGAIPGMIGGSGDQPQVITASSGEDLAQILGQLTGGATATPASEEDSPLEKLQVLADLHKQGALTDAEFDEQKKKLLGEL